MDEIQNVAAVAAGLVIELIGLAAAAENPLDVEDCTAYFAADVMAALVSVVVG